MNRPRIDQTNAPAADQTERRRFLQQLAAMAGTPALGALLANPAWAAANLDVLASPSPLSKPALALFESRTQINVRGMPYVSPTNSVATLLAGNSPLSMVITLPDGVKSNFAAAISSKRIQPFDMAKIPNAKSIAPVFKDDFMRQGDKTYAVPVIWGYNGVVYNRKLIKDNDPALKSWGILFDDKFKGKVAIRDDALEMIILTARFLGHPAPHKMTAKELADVKKFLISKKGNFRTLWSKFAEAMQLMTGGEVTAMYGWLTMKSSLQKQGADVGCNQPKEGLLFWVQSAFLTGNATEVEAAHKFVDFLLSSQNGQIMTLGTGVPSPSLLAKNALSAEDQKLYGYDILSGKVALTQVTPPEDMAPWLQAWAEFKNA